MHRHWAARTRLLAGVAGTLLLGRALFGTGFGRIPAAIAGASLLGKVIGDAQNAPRPARPGAPPGGAWQAEPV